jgi:hypothetical protein
MYQQIEHNGEVLAILIKSSFFCDGIHFFTPDEFSQQLAYMSRPKGYSIEPHIHNPVPRKVIYTQEVLFIKTGKVRVDFYDNDKNYIESQTLSTGDVILLAGGGHGLTALEDLEMIEVKQGPYAGEYDKTKFTAKREIK